MSKKRHAFSLVEALTGLIVIALIVGAMSMKSGSARQSIRREAERIAAYFNRLMQYADRHRNSFKITFSGGKFSITWAFKRRDLIRTPPFKLNPKYRLIPQASRTEIRYSLKNNNFLDATTVTLEDIAKDNIQDKDRYYIIIAVIGGRVRTSDEKPKD